MIVSRETRHRSYLDLLTRWGRGLNLVSKGQMSNLASHVADSLSMIPHLPNQLECLTDLGSGQGFPAIPLAIETGVRVQLIEADRRKAAFLTTALAHLRVDGTVWPFRIADTHLPAVRCVTARALAPLGELADHARRFVAADGCCLFLKGPAALNELTDFPHHDLLVSVIPGSDPSSCLVKVTGFR